MNQNRLSRAAKIFHNGPYALSAPRLLRIEPNEPSADAALSCDDAAEVHIFGIGNCRFRGLCMRAVVARYSLGRRFRDVQQRALQHPATLQLLNADHIFMPGKVNDLRKCGLSGNIRDERTQIGLANITFDGLVANFSSIAVARPVWSYVSGRYRVRRYLFDACHLIFLFLSLPFLA